VRHRDEDITYIYNLLEPEREEIRYYVEDVSSRNDRHPLKEIF